MTLGGRRDPDKSSNFPVHVFTETGNQVISTDLPLHLATYHQNQQFTNRFYLLGFTIHMDIMEYLHLLLHCTLILRQMYKCLFR